MKFEPLASQEAEKINRQADMQYGMKLVTDQDHWESMGITTGEELALEILTQTYSDTFKELRGVRPHRRFDSPEEAQEALEMLYDDYGDDYGDYGYDYGDDDWFEAAVEYGEEEMHDEDLLPDLPSREGMGRRFTESYDAHTRLRKIVHRVLSESSEPRT